MFAALATPIITEALIKEGRNHPQGTKTTGCLPLNTEIIRFSFQQLSFVSTLTKHCSLWKLLRLASLYVLLIVAFMKDDERLKFQLKEEELEESSVIVELHSLQLCFLFLFFFILYPGFRTIFTVITAVLVSGRLCKKRKVNRALKTVKRQSE